MNNKIDLRIVKTHAKLTQTLAEMMCEIPFDDITVFDLCEKAGVRRATFYKHFKDKYDFLHVVTTKNVNDIATSIISNNFNPFSPVEYFLRFVNEIIVYFEKYPGILSNILNSGSFPVLYETIISCTHASLLEKLRDANDRGANLDMDIAFTANFINGGIANILLSWFKDPTIEKEILLVRIKELLDKMFA
ncbi:MAG: TetR/AcrR family transcriptional regulator [Ruminococcaceae bacterium]|nr:TetR/AcrR family transcriptional regulator [Oscillospiraceae bacterium]